MKKSMILAAAAALALAACAKVETFQNTNEENAIRFGVYVPKTTLTKAVGEAGNQTVITLGDASKSGFGVFAFHSDNSSNGTSNDYNAASSNFLPNFMWNQQVNGDGDGTAAPTAWTYSPVKYWPNEHAASVTEQGIDKLTFFAYAPYVNANVETGAVGSETEGITALSKNDVTGDPTLTYVIPAAIDDQVDVLYADASSLKNLTKPASNAAVSFPFKHALTSVVFRVQTFIDGVNDTSNLEDEGAAVDGATTVTLKAVKFGGANVIPSGTLNIATGAWTPATAANKTFSKEDLSQSVTKTKANVSDMSPIMMIPNASSTSYKVNVVYEVKTTDSHIADGYSLVSNDIFKDINLTLVAGKKNIIDLVLGLYTVKVTSTVTDWENADPQEVDLPTNN